ncbi:30S ribosome-binding factor RbfA [Microbulbifer agarilyticus]|uniref:Ribosome-binding factor A n=1 Tax=Microbulbifer agarilyticus TaxID=260552 RepID=A0A1Q2M2E9_9GAMM|nr:30S ribosome-binding factor RbfA [Microbulbifer agarilyticus]AQQ66893.1 ribosome-binding factor A [Microbulbifer agarilyticus]MBY6190456.1 30S ribosome-binding factor RbfA [Microbulbifer agarilyticus]MBY6210451.1 30S ribosome-binding factor RbfA [Microbulbifer agarilyticus]MCA0892941.1 30S ribosome-binding factor RbfA [Microbulbifer agarilyticus]
MAKEFHRADRVADAMRRELARLIQHEVRDPRVGMVNVNDVEVSRDLTTAKVFVTLVGEDDRSKIDISMDALNKAAGFLRSQLAKEIQIRTIPRLQFRYDETSVRGQHLSALIDKAVKSDQKKSDDEPEEQND